MMVADGECCSDNNVYDSSSDMDTTMDEVAVLNENLATDKIIAAELDEEPDDAVHCWLLLSSQGIIVNESNDETWEQRLTPLQVRMCRLSVSNKHIGDRVQCGKSLATGIILELHMYFQNFGRVLVFLDAADKNFYYPQSHVKCYIAPSKIRCVTQKPALRITSYLV